MENQYSIWGGGRCEADENFLDGGGLGQDAEETFWGSWKYLQQGLIRNLSDDKFLDIYI